MERLSEMPFRGTYNPGKFSAMRDPGRLFGILIFGPLVVGTHCTAGSETKKFLVFITEFRIWKSGRRKN